MTNDVVAEPSQEQSKDVDQGNRKRSAPKDVEKELTKKRLRENTNAQTAPEAAGGKAFAVKIPFDRYEIHWAAPVYFMCKVELRDPIFVSDNFDVQLSQVIKLTAAKGPRI